MITISDKGAEKVHEFLAAQEAEVRMAGLRVGVRGGGCSASSTSSRSTSSATATSCSRATT